MSPNPPRPCAVCLERARLAKMASTALELGKLEDKYSQAQNHLFADAVMLGLRAFKLRCEHWPPPPLYPK